jgi:D-mannose binding lectin.
MMELRQSVAMNGSSGPDVYEALTWSRVDPAMPLRATDRTYLAPYCNGDLSLRGSNGALIWRSNTAGKGVVRFVLSNGGNLLLQNAKGEVVWRQDLAGRAWPRTRSSRTTPS